MQENAVVIASKEREAVLYLAEDAPRAVRIACTNFLTDLNKICGCPARMTHDAREANVLVGVIGEDAAVDALAEARYGALKEEGVLRWEAYVQTLLPDGGSSSRATAGGAPCTASTTSRGASACRRGTFLPTSP